MVFQQVKSEVKAIYAGDPSYTQLEVVGLFKWVLVSIGLGAITNLVHYWDLVCVDPSNKFSYQWELGEGFYLTFKSEKTLLMGNRATSFTREIKTPKDIYEYIISVEYSMRHTKESLLKCITKFVRP
jgi:hypothetical protein